MSKPRPAFGWPALLSAIALMVRTGWTADPAPTVELARIDQAIAAGASFLVGQQQDDGTWKSKTYGLLKDGTSLTPLVLVSLPELAATQAARERGLRVVLNWVDSESTPVHVRTIPQYPVYTAGLAMSLLKSAKTSAPAYTAAWRQLLVTHQLTESNGWSRTDSRFGGWGYSHDPPQKPDEGILLSPLDEPNLSATVFALEGLTASIPEKQTSAVRANALLFVQQCQNWREGMAPDDIKYNDGGFYFLLDDPIRNKPGVAGTDSTGQTRYVSYGSATADGLRALLLCGLKDNHPRVMAARKWLLEHFDVGAHPGAYPADRSHLRPSLDFYYAASISHAFRTISPGGATRSEKPWAIAIASRLVALQKENGSWQNTAVDVREDDPLIATSFGLQALQRCREELTTAKVK